MTPDLLECKAKRSSAGHTEPLLTRQVRLHRTEGFVKPTQLSTSDVRRLWSKIAVASPNECWEWTSRSKSRGYGSLSVGGRKGSMLLAHRLVYELTYGPIPEGFVVRHKCDNPGCCNPRHLLSGSQKDNARDMAERERTNTTKLTAVDVGKILDHLEQGVPQSAIARMYGVSQSNISWIAQGKTWTHIAREARP